MKTLATLVLLTLVVPPATAQKASVPTAAKVTLLGEVRDSTCYESSIAPSEKFLACVTAKPDLRIIDLASRKATVLFKGMFAADLFWSRAGDRVAFSGREEGSEDFYVWTVGVDPRTGLQTTPPRRVSASAGGVPAFSPDGQLIAFHQDAGKNNRKLVVAPANGGAERVLTQGDIFGPYSWSSDGRWIYYPLFPRGRSDSSNAIYRVAAAGGTPERIIQYNQLGGRAPWYYHGLSRDGRFLGIGTRPLQGSQLKALLDAQGKTLGVASLPSDLRSGTSSDYDWMPTGPRLFLTTQERPSTLRAVTMAGGTPRDLASPAERPRAPSWSPDGRRIAVQLWNGTRFDLAVMNADGSGRRFLNAASEPVENFVVDYWSPDGRYIAYLGPMGRELHVIEVTTGIDTRLATADLRIVNTRWSADSRSVRFVSVNGSPDATRSSLRSVTLDAQQRTVRDLGSGPTAFLFVTEDLLLAVVDGTLVPFGPGEPRRVHAPTSVRPKPGVSRDGRWVAFMPNGLGGGQRPGLYDVVSADGETRTVVHLPPGIRATAPLFSRDGRSLIVPTPRGPDGPARLLIVPVNGDTPRTLTSLGAEEGFLSLTRSPDWYFDASLSPDGASLLYIAAGLPVQRFFSVDLSPALTQRPAATPQ